MTYTIGQNCHITLSHPEVDGGTPYGFLCDLDSKIMPGGVRVVHEVISDGTQVVYVHANILIAENMHNPNGSLHTAGRPAMYAKLLQYFTKTSGVVLSSPIGGFTNLGFLGYSLDERHNPSFSLIKVQLNNVGYYWPPVDPEVLALSLWDGTLTWATSYWR
ncbi:MAG TPA: hypothetical protein VN376_00260 [Longilinea sp.]|nr:hypothetical protein [Longilinea sp.]